MANPIEAIEAKLFQVPLAEPMEDASHGVHSHFDLVTAQVRLRDGTTGVGYTYTGGIGGRAVLALLQHDLVPCLLGKDADDVEGLHAAMQAHVHYVGRGGIASFAIAALDIALWDIRGKTSGQPLWKMAGGSDRSCQAYCGGIDLNYSLDKLLANVEGYLKRGFAATKIKVGKPELAEDVSRLKAVRELLGTDRACMVDANYSMAVPQAIKAAQAFAAHDILWFEEPIQPDDYQGYKTIAKSADVPLAMGENLRNQREFEMALNEAGLSFIQPDASNCGGITGWLQVAKMAQAKGVVVSSHGMQELHVSLVSGWPGADWLEVHSFAIDSYATRQLVVEDHRAVAPDVPGTGVDFAWDKLREFEVAS